MKKRVISVLLAATMVLGAVGCGSSQEEKDTSETKESETTEDVAAEETTEDVAEEAANADDKPFAGETITVYASFVEKEGWQDLVDFVEEETGIIMEGIAAPSNYSDVVTKLSSSLSAGDDTFDLVHVDELLGVTYSAAGYLEPITDVMEPELEYYPEGTMENISKAADGEYYLMPIDMGPMYFFVNTDVMEAAGVEVPTTKEEFIEAAQAMTGDGVYGYGASWSKGGQLYNDVVRWVYAFDGDMYDWTNEGTKEALQFMYDMLYEYEIVSEAALGDTYDAMNQKIIDDKYGMAFQWGYLAGVSADAGKWENGLEIADMPTFTTNNTIGSGWLMAINKNSKKIDAAKEVLKVWASKEGAMYNLNWDGSCHTEVLATAEAKEVAEQGTALEEYMAAGVVQPRPMPVTANELLEVVENYAGAYLTKEITLDECVEKATKDIQALIE